MERMLKLQLLVGICLAGMTTVALPQIAQEPLLNRLNSVAPNLVLILDTSGSMDKDSIYEYGNADVNGPLGPGPDSGGVDRGARSPDVNKLYYDPRVRYRPRVNYDGTFEAQDAPTSGSWQVYFLRPTFLPVSPYTTGGSLSLASAYWTSYVPLSGTAVPRTPPLVYPTSISSSLPGWTLLPKFLNRTDCTTHADACTYAEERQNHSNWKKWYRTRSLMAQTGLAAALQPVVADSIRLGYGTLSGLNSNRQLSAGISSYSAGVGGGKQRFFNWLYAQTFSGGTPNLHAVNNVGIYYERADSDGPWGTTPNPSSVAISSPAPADVVSTELPADHASCRRSFTLLVTDGYWNSGQPSTTGNADARADFPPIAPPVGPAFTYTPTAPYADSNANTLADIAMHYWVRDLRPTLPNRVPPLNTTAGQNISFWQNSSFYAVTLGLLGTLPRTATVTAELASDARAWPQPVANDPTTIDDTWHATVNGRGELINANNSQELTDAIGRVLTGVAGTPQTQSGVAVSAVMLRNGTRKYKPEYVPGSWTGRLSAVELDPATGNDKLVNGQPVIHWKVESGLDANGDPVSTIPAHGARNIATWNGTAGVNFNAANTGLNSDLVNYVRGDTSKEGRKPGGVFRNRLSRLGDIVNSNPVFVRENIDLRYEDLGIPGYREFVEYKAARNGVLFVGANDGMLHAFRDSDGRELFAYVPGAVLGQLHHLTQVPFTHRYFVDGPNVETDSHNGLSWRNMLLGTTGAGAKAVYALDVTDPNHMQPGHVSWEVNQSTPGFGNLGHVLSEVQAGVTANGRWIAVFGNGFGSTNGRAAFFVVDLHTGELLAERVPHTGPGNGMGGVRLAFDGNRRVIGAYAGDLLGNLWKLDLTGNYPVDWSVGLAGAPLYAAGSAQPITAAPTVMRHPDRGHMVVFGTGKFFETGDASPPYTPQRLYGVWDAQPFGATSTPPGSTLSGTGRLLQRTIATTTIGQAQYFTVSSGPVSWGDGAGIGLRGWYLDLPNAGQRMIHPLEPLAGTFLLASSISPESSSPPDVCVASGSGSGWVYIIDGITGSGPTIAALDTNGDGTINDSDVVVGGYRDVVDGRPSPISLQPTANASRLCIETAQSICTQIRLQCGQIGAPACPVNPTDRIKSRSWRQLFMR